MILFKTKTKYINLNLNLYYKKIVKILCVTKAKKSRLKNRKHIPFELIIFFEMSAISLCSP